MSHRNIGWLLFVWNCLFAAGCIYKMSSTRTFWEAVVYGVCALVVGYCAFTIFRVQREDTEP